MNYYEYNGDPAGGRIIESRRSDESSNMLSIDSTRSMHDVTVSNFFDDYLRCYPIPYNPTEVVVTVRHNVS